ncbi:acyl-CoA thioesterase [Kitasatospora sp. NPDC001095]
MSTPVDDLVDLLDLEQIELNIFRGRSPEEALQRTFGGQVAGQALVAAGRTVDDERPVHSLHAYFLRPGVPGVPIVYQVDRIRDGRSFTTRRVLGIQGGRSIFALTADFHRPEEAGIEHQYPMPAVAAPEGLPSALDEVGSRLGELPPFISRRQPFDIRYVDRLRWSKDELAGVEARSGVWLRTNGPLPDDPLIHVCALTYASDMTLLDAVRAPVEPLWGERNFDMASLDHAMWFHQPFRTDDWLLYQQESPIAHGARGLARGQIFDRHGRLVVSVVQEGLFRPLKRHDG